MTLLQKILAFIEPLFGADVHILSLRRYKIPFCAGDHLFSKSFIVERRYYFSNALACRETIFCTVDDIYYSASGERWTPHDCFHVAFQEFLEEQDQHDAPLRKEVFAEILSEEN